MVTAGCLLPWRCSILPRPWAFRPRPQPKQTIRNAGRQERKSGMRAIWVAAQELSPSCLFRFGQLASFAGALLLLPSSIPYGSLFSVPPVASFLSAGIPQAGGTGRKPAHGNNTLTGSSPSRQAAAKEDNGQWTVDSGQSAVVLVLDSSSPGFPAERHGSGCSWHRVCLDVVRSAVRGLSEEGLGAKRTSLSLAAGGVLAKP